MSNNWTVANIPDLSGKVAIVTGANVGLGFETAKELARKGAQTIMACRNMSKAENALAEILREIPNAPIEIMQLDLASLTSVKQFAEAFQAKYEHLDLLINNAGIMMVPYGKTEDGFERQFGTNHLGHFALTGLLMETIRKTDGARVVNVSSNGHRQGNIDFDNLQYEGGTDYSIMGAYGRSKLANLLFTYELQRYFEEEGVDAMAVASHPGLSATNLANHLIPDWLMGVVMPLMTFLGQNAAMGALPSLRAAVDPDAKGGEYYGPRGFAEFSGYPVRVESSSASHNREDAKKLWDVSEGLTGVRYPVALEVL